MSPVGLIVIALGLVGAIALIAALGQVWAIGGQAEAPVSAWSSRKRQAAPDPVVPRELSGLVWGEAVGWQRPEQWSALVVRLDQLERNLGGTPTTEPAPEKFSQPYLDQRIAQLEALAGPLPSPIRAQ